VLVVVIGILLLTGGRLGRRRPGTDRDAAT
jgi:hypothetical protein